jgi:hypothetical protein
MKSLAELCMLVCLCSLHSSDVNSGGMVQNKTLHLLVSGLGSGLFVVCCDTHEQLSMGHRDAETADAVRQ